VAPLRTASPCRLPGRHRCNCWYRCRWSRWTARVPQPGSCLRSQCRWQSFLPRWGFCTSDWPLDQLDVSPDEYPVVFVAESAPLPDDDATVVAAAFMTMLVMAQVPFVKQPSACRV